jgi:CheY-like chemotaxis protein
MTNSYSSKPTIYLADDDPEDLEMLLQAFQQLTNSHHLKVISNGEDLIELLSHTDDSLLPCLIVLDYNMPGLNGKQIVTYLQSTVRYKSIPIVIYSTSSSFREKKEFLSIGASEFLTKATSTNDILNSARKMLSFCDEEIGQSAL